MRESEEEKILLSWEGVEDRVWWKGEELSKTKALRRKVKNQVLKKFKNLRIQIRQEL